MQAAFNKELILSGVFSAWQKAFLETKTLAGKDASLYHLLPDKPDNAAGSESIELQLFKQVCSGFGSTLPQCIEVGLHSSSGLLKLCPLIMTSMPGPRDMTGSIQTPLEAGTENMCLLVGLLNRLASRASHIGNIVSLPSNRAELGGGRKYLEKIYALQILLAAASGQNWAVWKGETAALVNLADGVFVQGDLAKFGAQGAEFVRQQLPLFNVPWRVRVALQHAGVDSCRELTPAVLR